MLGKRSRKQSRKRLVTGLEKLAAFFFKNMVCCVYSMGLKLAAVTMLEL